MKYFHSIVWKVHGMEQVITFFIPFLLLFKKDYIFELEYKRI